MNDVSQRILHRCNRNCSHYCTECEEHALNVDKLVEAARIARLAMAIKYNPTECALLDEALTLFGINTP